MKQRTLPLLNSTEDRSRLWRNFVESLRSYPLVGMGFCLWWTWIILIYQSTSILPSVQEGGLLVPASIGPLSVIAITLLCVAGLYYRMRFTLKGPAYFALIAICMTFGGVLTVLWRATALEAGALGLVLYALSSLAIGCSSAFMYIEYNRVFGWLGMLKTLFFSIVSLLCSTCIITALSFSPTVVLYAFFIASPGLMALMLYRTVRAKFPARAYAEHGNEAKLYIPVKFIATSFMEGLSFGLMFGGLVVDGSLVLHPGITLAGHLLTVALLVASTFFFKLDFNRLMYQIGFPLMAFGFLLISCLPDTMVAGRHRPAYRLRLHRPGAVGAWILPHQERRPARDLDHRLSQRRAVHRPEPGKRVRIVRHPRAEPRRPARIRQRIRVLARARRPVPFEQQEP